jgi:hypothetical protein
MAVFRLPGLARPNRGINHVLSYGQSLSNGWEGSPALTRQPRLDTLMFGESVRPASENAASWDPVGGPAFCPLRATVQQHWGGPVMPPDLVAAMPPRDALLGETVLEAALNHWRARMGTDADPGWQLLGSACGVGGRPIEALSRGADPELFNRLRDCVRGARSLATATGRSYRIVAIILMQGEHNNFAVGGTLDKERYGGLMRRLYADIVDEVVRGIAGQDLAPALFTYQTGGKHATGTNSIPQAQLETSLSLPGCFMAGPCYPMPTKIDHLDANGYRWLGAQFGKVMHRVLSLGEAWRPLHPVAAVRDGNAVRLSFHVPHPPLAWGRPYVGHRATDVPDRGFAMFDGAGEVPISDVALTGPTELRIAAARPLCPGVRVQYASAARGGHGCLHDSDPTVSDDVYEYALGRGHWPTANISELVGRPYPLVNWCVAFTIDAG